ncbi:MAG: hypothetical protein RLZZ444_194 [Pseudomonadota bacterium]
MADRLARGRSIWPDVEDRTSLAKHDDPVRQSHRFLDVMGDHYRAKAMFDLQALHETLHVEPGQGVERTERFVQKENFRRPQQGPGK